MSELAQRVLVAVPAAAVFLYLTWLGGPFFYLMMILIGLLVVKETVGLFEASGLSPHPYFPYTFALWILLLPALPHALPIGLLLVLVFLLLQLPISSEENIRTLGSTVFSAGYGPLGILVFILIRSQAEGEQGFMLALSLLLMVWGNDIFAYFGGKSLGKHLMAPKISPKKTWEGFAFGVLGALVGFCVVLYLIPLSFNMTLLEAIPAVLLVSIFGPTGDLTASKMKRACQAKDTSNLLPGHGGILDRFDALILAAPAYYIYLYVLKLYGYVSF